MRGSDWKRVGRVSLPSLVSWQGYLLGNFQRIRDESAIGQFNQGHCADGLRAGVFSYLIVSSGNGNAGGALTQDTLNADPRGEA